MEKIWYLLLALGLGAALVYCIWLFVKKFTGKL